MYRGGGDRASPLISDFFWGSQCFIISLSQRWWVPFLGWVNLGSGSRLGLPRQGDRGVNARGVVKRCEEKSYRFIGSAGSFQIVPKTYKIKPYKILKTEDKIYFL